MILFDSGFLFVFVVFENIPKRGGPYVRELYQSYRER